MKNGMFSGKLDPLVRYHTRLTHILLTISKQYRKTIVSDSLYQVFSRMKWDENELFYHFLKKIIPKCKFGIIYCTSDTHYLRQMVWISGQFSYAKIFLLYNYIINDFLRNFCHQKSRITSFSPFYHANSSFSKIKSFSIWFNYLDW